MDQTLGSSSVDVLSTPVPGGRSLTTQQRGAVDLSASIPGWGSDLDPARRPGVPHDKAPHLGVESLYPASIEQQQATVKIHKSTEHGRLTPVFGTTCPPAGLSGKVRDFAYTLSEGRLSRWIALLVADRINVVEEVVVDLSKGTVPNIFKEIGLESEWKHNRSALVQRVAVTGAFIAIGAMLLRKPRR